MSIATFIPLPTPPPASLAAPLANAPAPKRRHLDTTDGLVSVSAHAWGLTWRRAS
jgi:hypothetical protein